MVSRAAKDLTYLNKETVSNNIGKVQKLNVLAEDRGQKLSQMAIAWILRQPQVASVLVGASSSNQLKENVKALDYLDFSTEELKLINGIIS